MSDAKEEILDLLETYFSFQEAFNGDGMLASWHSEGKMYLVGNNNEFRIVTIEEQANHINETRKRVPAIQVRFVIDEVEQITIHDDLIASAHLRWRMIFPEGYGKHRTFFNLANIDGKWAIVNTVDRGFQVMSEN